MMYRFFWYQLFLQHKNKTKQFLGKQIKTYFILGYRRAPTHIDMIDFV